MCTDSLLCISELISQKQAACPEGPAEILRGDRNEHF
jgi:hypothetical protein